jgi:hypothetical protein
MRSVQFTNVLENSLAWPRLAIGSIVPQGIPDIDRGKDPSGERYLFASKSIGHNMSRANPGCCFMIAHSLSFRGLDDSEIVVEEDDITSSF